MRFFLVFWSRIQKYLILIVRDRYWLIVSFAITAAVLFSMHTCVMGCRWNISYNMFRIMMTYFSVMKHPSVSASTAEAATNFKMLQFICIWPYRWSCAHFEVVIPTIKYPIVQLRASGSVWYDASVLAHKIMPEAWNMTTAFEYVDI